MADYTHLHLHTQYSFLDGAIHMKDLCPRIAELGMKSCAITDHANLFGAIDFYRRAKAEGIKPILGFEAYVAEKGMADRTSRRAFHLVLLAKNRIGYQNLMYLVSMGYKDGFYYKPRIDKQMLKERSEGLFALSACLGGEVPQSCMAGDLDQARQSVREYKSIFAPEHFFLELQHTGIEEQRIVNDHLKQLAADEGVPLVATNNCHYKMRDDAAAHDVLMAIQHQKSVNDPTRRRQRHDSFYIRSAEEMATLFRDCREAIDNTQRIVEQIDLELVLGKPMLPTFVPPDGSDIDSYLIDRTKQGLERRFTELPYQVDREQYRARLDEELRIIIGMKFPGYFLIVADFINWAKEHDIPVGPGRGSGAGSLVAYALRITDLDPIPYALLFERFLNPERVSMPDFDVDFCQERRGEVINYVTQKYGASKVGQIATFAQMKAKSVIKDVARSLEVPFTEVNELTKLLPNTYKDEKGNVKPITLEKALEMEPKLRMLQEEKPVYKKVIQIAEKLEGLYRQAGMHAAGIVIADADLWDVVPIFHGTNDELITQFSMADVEDAGLVKFDFLGLKTLDVIYHAEHHVNRRVEEEHARKDWAGLHGHPHLKRKYASQADLQNAKLEDLQLACARLALDDLKVYKLIGRGETLGVFQMESTGFQELLKKLKPDCFEDIVAAGALYRPGPLQTGMVDDFVECKNGRKSVRYPHPLLEHVLKPTYGVFAYQEQVMQAAQVMAGYSLGAADLLRRAMGKKKAEAMAKERSKFVAGCKLKQISEHDSGEVFDLMEKFAGYGFNKCVVGETEIVDADTGERTTVGGLFAARRKFRVHALGDNWKLAPRRVTDVVWNGRKRVFALETESGKRIVATGNHPFRTLDGWKNLSDLREGDRVAAPRRLDVDAREEWSDHELVVLGGLLAEGNTCHPTCLYFYSNEASAIRDFCDHATQFVNTVAKVDIRTDARRYEVCLSTGRDTRFKKGRRVSGNLAQAEPTRSGAFDLDILGKKATEKFIPPVVFRLSDRCLEILVGRMWAGDGFIANATNFVPYYATSSRRLGEDVRLLLLRLGMPSVLKQKTFAYRGTEKIGFTVHLVGEGTIETFLARIAPHCVSRERAVERLSAYVRSTDRGKSSKDTIPADVRRWVDDERTRAGLTWRQVEEQSGISVKELWGRGNPTKRGFRRETIAQLGRFFASGRLEELAAADVYWERITSIEPAGVRDTYDLTVEGDHNFVADGLIVHNSHSAAYALVTFQTAYLKTYYPTEFMAALLSTEASNTANIVKYIAETRAMGTEVLPPTVNDSDISFTVAGDKIRFGLGAVKGLGGAALEALLVARNLGGEFRSLYDFCERVPLKQLNKKTLETLVKSGAFDGYGRPRAMLMEALERAIEAAKSTQRAEAVGQGSLFSAPSLSKEVKPREVYDEAIVEWPELERLKLEKNALGFYVSGHPLDRYVDDLRRIANATIAELPKKQNRSEVFIGCVVTALKEVPVRDGSGRRAFVSIEDRSGALEMLVPVNTYEQISGVLKSDLPIVVKASVFQDRDEEGNQATRIRCLGAKTLAEARKERTKGIVITVDPAKVDERRLSGLKQLFEQSPNGCPVRLVVRIPSVAEVEMRLPPRATLEATDETVDRVEQLFGLGTARFS